MKLNVGHVKGDTRLKISALEVRMLPWIGIIEDKIRLEILSLEKQ